MPVQQIKHNNDGKFYHIAIDIAKEGAQLFDLTPYVKGRVGDNNFGLLVDWYRQGMLMNVNGAYKPIIDGLVGNFSFDKNGNLKMDDDASPVYSVGKPEDCGPAGQVTYYFPEQMFPKEGIFKGYLGLIDDKGNRYSGVDIWFSVLAGNPRMGIACDYYISELAKAIKEAEEDLKAGQKEQQQILDEYSQKVTDLINQVNGQAADVQTTLANLRTTILALEAKAEKDNLFTQAEADVFKQEIQKQLNGSLTNLNDRLTNVEDNLEPFSVEQSDFSSKDIMHHGHLAVHKKTYGRYQNATGMSVMVNDDDKAKVEGNSLEFIAKHYNGRDSAGLYVENSRIPYLLHTTDTKFTATSVTVLDESVDLSNVKPGMLIDTSKRANIDKDWYVTAVKSVDGSTINTELWYKVQSNPNAETVTGTPADGLAITVNPMVGAWGANFNIFIPQENAEAGTALELGVFSKSKAPQDIVGLRITSGDEFINNGAKATGRYSNAYDAVNTSGGTAYNVDPKAKTDFYFRAQNPDGSANWFVNSQGQIMHESIVPHFATGASGDYGKDDSLIIFNGNGDQTINLDYGRYGRLVRVVAMSEGTKTIYAKPESSSMNPGTSWFLDTGNEGKNVHSLTLNKATGKVAVTLLDAGNVFVAL